MGFEPRLDILPKSQPALCAELDAVPSKFVLYGGTALALQLGHRSRKISISSLRKGSTQTGCDRVYRSFAISNKTDSARCVHYKPDDLEGYVENRGRTVKVAFFGGLDTLRRVEIRPMPLDHGYEWLLSGGFGGNENAGHPSTR